MSFLHTRKKCCTFFEQHNHTNCEFQIISTTFPHRIGSYHELSQEQHFRLQIGNLKGSFAIENAIFNRFRSTLGDNLRLPPIRCVFQSSNLTQLFLFDSFLRVIDLSTFGEIYCNVPKFSDKQVWANSADQGLHWSVCNSLCIFWMHYSKEKPSCTTFRGERGGSVVELTGTLSLNTNKQTTFRVITANFRVSEILGFLQ